MAKQTEESIVDVEEVVSKGEQFFEENKKSISIIGGAVVVLIAFYAVYSFLYLAPMEKEAQADIWQAEKYFEVDSFRMALNGVDGVFVGFLDVAEEYGPTKTGNLANYYAGICYLNMGEYDSAIEHLESFDGDDEMLGAVAEGAIGDAHAQLGDLSAAVGYYESAASKSDNEFTAPIYLQKAGDTYADLGEYAKATKAYEKIKFDYPESDPAKDVEKYISRVSVMGE